MLNNKFILRSDESDITIKGGFLNQIPDHAEKQVLNIGPSAIDIILTEDTGLEHFEKALMSAVRKKNFFSYLLLILTNRLGSILTLVIALAVIILIALLSIHGSLTYDLFSGSESSNIFNLEGPYLYLLLSLLILLFLVISPRIILGEYDNMFEWASARFSTNTRLTRRLVRELKVLMRAEDGNMALNIWNPMIKGKDAWTCTQLLPAASMLNCDVNILIRTGDREDILQILKSAGIWDTHFSQTAKYEARPGMTFPFGLLTKWERECMHCLIFSSTMNLPEAWKEKGNDRDMIVSKELAEQVYQLYEPKLSTSGTGNTTFEKFMSRCIYDYGYLEAANDQRHQNFVLMETALPEELSPGLMEGMADAVKNNLGSLLSSFSDPLALVLLLGLAGSDEALTARKIDLVRELIRNIKRTENYWLINKYWNCISPDMSRDDTEFRLGLLQFLDVPALNDLATCFVNAGMYDNAFEVFGILEHIYPARIAIEIADLKDSLGEYREALDILLRTDEEWVRSGMVDDRALILELYLNIAWVIVSGRFEDRKKEGYRYLEKTDNILKKLPDTGKYLLFLTRFYNTKANYHEWEQHYDLAIENYRKALKLPGTILRKSSLLSNWGIAERYLGKIANDPVMKRKHFLASRFNIQQAVKMKKSIGERNQIPGSSHNLAETLLELAGITTDKTEKAEVLKEVDRVTSVALGILDELGSSKRRGRLLTERYIAHHLLSELGQASEADLIRPALTEWLQEEEKSSHDYRETTGLLKRFGIEV